MKTIFITLFSSLLLTLVSTACKKSSTSPSLQGSWEIYQTNSEGIQETNSCHYCFHVFVAHGITFKSDHEYGLRYYYEGVWSATPDSRNYYVKGTKLIFYGMEGATEEWTMLKRTDQELQLSKNGYTVYLKKSK